MLSSRIINKPIIMTFAIYPYQPELIGARFLRIRVQRFDCQAFAARIVDGLDSAVISNTTTPSFSLSGG